jgi:plastocyanin
MDDRLIDKLARRLATPRSRRQVLTTAGKGTIGGFGAALLGSSFSTLLDPSRALALQGAEVTVTIENFAFDPPMLEIDVGTTVTWVNEDSAPHTATADDGSFDSGRLNTDDTFSHTFDAPGTIDYHCEFHAAMTATIIVNELASVTPYTRPNVHSLDPNGPELTAFADGVTAMKALPDSDPRSWSYQANIHGTRAPLPWSDLWYTCEHQNIYFWPWHRMYLYWFEQIVRDQSGYADFALPYWDYSNPSQRYLPEPFRDPNNPLYVSKRRPSVNLRGPNDPPPDGSWFNYCNGLSQSSFGDYDGTPGASDRLEGDVHDNIHGWVGGGTQMDPGIMSAVSTSAQDPVFWLHHANMDRLWSSWRVLTLNGASHTDPQDPAWQNQEYEFFNEAGDKINPAWLVSGVLDTVTDLGYDYEALADNAWFMENCPEFAPPPPLPPEDGDADPGTPTAGEEIGRNAPEGEIEVGPDPIDVPLLLAEADFLATPEARAGVGLVLTLDGIQGTGVPGVTVEIYINLPPDRAPDFRSPNYVGNLGLFTLQPWDADSPHAGHAATQYFDISRNIDALEAIGEWTGEVTVNLVPVELDDDAGLEFADATPVATPAATPRATPEAAREAWVVIESITLSER